MIIKILFALNTFFLLFIFFLVNDFESKGLMRVSLISNDWIIIYCSLELLGRCAYFMRFPIVLIATTENNKYAKLQKFKSHDFILIAVKK